MEWNGTLNLIPSMVKDTDFDNNGEPGFTYDNFFFGSLGLGAQFGDARRRRAVNVPDLSPGQRAPTDLVIANFGAGYLLLRAASS